MAALSLECFIFICFIVSLHSHFEVTDALKLVPKSALNYCKSIAWVKYLYCFSPGAISWFHSPGQTWSTSDWPVHTLWGQASFSRQSSSVSVCLCFIVWTLSSCLIMKRHSDFSNSSSSSGCQVGLPCDVKPTTLTAQDTSKHLWVWFTARPVSNISQHTDTWNNSHSSLSFPSIHCLHLFILQVCGLY